MNRISFFQRLALLSGAFIATAFALPHEAAAADILYLRDTSNGTDQLLNALVASGYTVIVAKDPEDFGKQLVPSSILLGVLEIQSADPQEYAPAITALQRFVTNGGKAIYSEWSGNSTFSAPFGATFTAGKNQSQVVIQDARLRSAGSTTETLQLRNTEWFQFSSGLAPSGNGATAAATYTNGEAAIVFGNQGRSVVFGYRSDAPTSADVYQRTLSTLLNPAVPYPQAVTGPVAELTSTSAQLTGKVNPHGLPTSVVFEYAANGGSPITTPGQVVNGGNNEVQVRATISNLTPYTDYTYRVRATSSGGISIGSEETFTTNLVPKAVDDTVRLSSTTREITVELLANDYDSDGDPVTLTSFGNTANGTLVNNGDGTVTYTRGVNFKELDSFTYEISDGHGGSATAVVTLLEGPERLNGRYQQLLIGTMGTVDGLLQISVNSRGAFTGSLWFEGQRFPISGVLKLGSTKVLVKTRKNASELTLELQLVHENDRSRLAGSVSDGTNSWTLNTARLAFSRKNLPPEAGQHYTMVFEANQASDPDYGHGWALFDVASSGAVRLTGQLGDGAPFSTMAFITPNAQLPLYIVPSKQPKSTLAGTLVFQSESQSDVTGTLMWTRTDGDTPGGQVEVVPVPTRGSRYKAPKRGELALRFSSNELTLGDISFSGEPLPAPFTRLLRFGPGFTTRVENAGDERLIFQGKQANGRVMGTLRYPSKPVLRLNGVILQKANAAMGNVGEQGEYGSFVVTPR